MSVRILERKPRAQVTVANRLEHGQQLIDGTHQLGFVLGVLSDRRVATHSSTPMLVPRVSLVVSGTGGGALDVTFVSVVL